MKQKKDYIPVIGLEIHVELKTNSKMFCSCSADHFRVKPNTHTCPVCLGLPGSLPVPNRKAIKWCQKIGLALGGRLKKFSKFDRKNYFYPDLPKGYQISQYDQPLSVKGEVKLTSGKRIGITRVHMEEDTGKLIHKKLKSQSVSLIDFNRSGVPLVEIVSEPDISSAEEADEFLKIVQQIIRYLQKISDCDMEKGSMRLEVNLSLAQSEGDLPDYKVEVKNINSFRFVRKAIEHESERQASLLNQGITPTQETRGYDEKSGRTKSQRSKEQVDDYRYFPEPDIPPMKFSQKEIDQLKVNLPELPRQKRERFEKVYQLTTDLARILTKTRELAEYFERAAIEAKKNQVAHLEIAKEIVNRKINPNLITANQLVLRIKRKSSGLIKAKKTLASLAKNAIKTSPSVARDYRAGKTQALDRLIGEVMKLSKGKASPQTTRQILVELLQGKV